MASARYDAIIAREMAQAAAFAALMANGRSQDQARQLAQNTLGQAAKNAAHRMRERPHDRDSNEHATPEEPLEEGDGAAAESPTLDQVIGL